MRWIEKGYGIYPEAINRGANPDGVGVNKSPGRK
jgi:hypothetical protein